MSAKQSSSWSLARVGLVVGLFSLAGYALWPGVGVKSLAADLDNRSAVVMQTKDKTVVAVNLVRKGDAELSGRLSVELVGPDGKILASDSKLVGPDGKILASDSKDVKQTEALARHIFELPAIEGASDKTILRIRFNDARHDVPLSQVLLAKAHETTLSASAELSSGSPTALRCGVHACKSYSEDVPLPGAQVTVRLKGADGKTVTVHEGKTAANGVDEARFVVPTVPPGKYTLQIATRSDFGEETIEREVKIKGDPKIMLVTDKPVYQPGQIIHIRALSLKPMNLAPVANSEVIFEVEDGKGNKVFKKAEKTTEFGVAAVDFQLADEVNMGDFHVRAILGEHEALKTVAVKRYVLPKFKIDVKSDKAFYLPKETVHVDLQADYTFGKAVANSKIKVTASTFDVQFKDFTTWEGNTDENGHAKFEIQLPAYFVGQPLENGKALVKLDALVTDSADHSEKVTKTYTVSDQPIRISLIPEGGRLVPGVENRVFAAAIYPDGTPAQCDVRLWLERLRFNSVPNMSYKYYEGSWNQVPDFEKMKPAASGAAAGFDLELRRRDECFGLRFEGYVKIDEEGEYAFHLTSDDGSKLWIDDNLTVVNDFEHAATTVTQKVKLTKGMHHLVTDMFNNRGPFAFGVEIEGPGTPRQDLSARVFMTPEGNPKKQKQEDVVKPLAQIKTNESGLAEFRFTPDAAHFHAGAGFHQIEMLGGQMVQTGEPTKLFDLSADAKDAQGHTAYANVVVNCDGAGNNVLLRLDKAIYRGGETMKANIRTTGDAPTVYFDLVRNGQTLLTRWLDVEVGKATCNIDLPADVFGTVEVHAYQMLANASIVRDSRVVYVHPAQDLKISVAADKDVYRPGEEGKITFRVTDASGKPTQAALGVMVVDEAVYALQEMQPGLEKVYFTLQEELMKPRAEVHYHPNTPIDMIVQEQQIQPAKQQIAEVLLTAVRPNLPLRVEVDPGVQRRMKVAGQTAFIANALWRYAENNSLFERTEKSAPWAFKSGLVKELAKAGLLAPQQQLDPFGQPLDVSRLGQLDPRLAAESFAGALTQHRMQILAGNLIVYADQHRATFLKGERWSFPANVLDEMAKEHNLPASVRLDAWGESIRLVKLAAKWNHGLADTQFDYYQLISAGPDRKSSTDDDVKQATADQVPRMWWNQGFDRDDEIMEAEQLQRAGGDMKDARGGAGGPFFRGKADLAAPAPVAARLMLEKGAREENKAVAKEEPAQDRREAGSAPSVRVREFFPETLLWQPSLITDEHGKAVLPVNLADSITTWRLNASASSKGGLLGGVSAPLRVFQDFFVDLDLPVALMENDEVAFPVAVYNYLKEPQTVKLQLEEAPWFELVDAGGYQRSLDLKPNEIASVKFRIKARKVGSQPLTVKATGGKVADAIKRMVEVLPDGEKIETVVTDRLTAKTTHTFTIPDAANPDASKIIVKVYPGVFSQLVEGLEGMMRMPTGCFEQTSSSAYPNIMVVNYVNKTKTASPEMKMKAEQYLNVGYQRLLTFERPGGGFDWWGSGEPLVWLSAYGLQEFSDMAKVYPIDRAVIERTQKWLLSKQAADGTWSNIGATHSETIASMGNPKLLLTSYVAWSLLDSGLTVEKSPQLQRAVDYILEHTGDAGDNAYVTALVANALVAWDAKDDRTFALLKKLDKMQLDLPEQKAIAFPSNGRSLTYAHGDCVTVETTALAALAMSRSGQFTNTVNKALTYLVKAKAGNGTWGTTSATILSLKALSAGLGFAKQEGKATFTVRLDGQQVAAGEITELTGDVLQQFELKNVAPGKHDVEINLDGATNMMYQIVSRHYEPWKDRTPKEPQIEVGVTYDRTELTTADIITAKATLKYNGEIPTYMVMVDLGIPPGFTVDPGEFAEMVGQKKVQKFTITSRQVTLYIGDVKKDDVKTFEYTLRPKYPIKAKAPAVVAYEYNAPTNRAATQPVEIAVTQK